MLIVFQDLTVPAAFCFATGMYATGSIPVLLVGTRSPELVRRAATAVHQVAVLAGHDLNRAVASARHHLTPATACALNAVFTAREMARDVAALLLMLTTIPRGDHR